MSHASHTMMTMASTISNTGTGSPGTWGSMGKTSATMRPKVMIEPMLRNSRYARARLSWPLLLPLADGAGQGLGDDPQAADHVDDGREYEHQGQHQEQEVWHHVEIVGVAHHGVLDEGDQVHHQQDDHDHHEVDEQVEQLLPDGLLHPPMRGTCAP